MQKLLRFIFSLALVFGLSHGAYAGFSSVYGYASTTIPTPSATSPNVVLGGSFQSMYAPTGVSGCSIGVPELRSLCSQPGYGSLQLQFPGYSFPTVNEVKVYIPAGTMRVTLVASMPQGAIAAAALRMDTAPTRTAELSSAEYVAAQAAMKYDTVFKQLLAGAEVIQTHDGGGTFTIAWGYANGSNSQLITTVGHWLYIRFINQADLYQLMGSTLVNITAYQAGYGSIQWDANGDPVDTGSGTSPVVNPTPTTTPLTGISLSTSSLVKGSASTVAITPIPSNASLGTCTSSPSGLVNIGGNTISLAAGASAITSATPVTITCGSVSQVLTIQPNTLPATTTISFSKDSLVSTDTDTDTKIGTLVVVSPSSSSASLPACNATQKTPSGASVASSFIHWADSPTNSKFSLAAGAAVVTQPQTITITCGTATKDFTIRLPLTVTQSVDANGILTLSFPFNVGTSSASDLYVLAYVPDIIVKSFGSVKDDLYVYQVTGDTWKPILFADPEVEQTVTSGSTVFINTGLPKTLLQGLNVYIYAAYLPSGNKDFSALQFIGDAAAPAKLPSSTPLWQPK